MGRLKAGLLEKQRPLGKYHSTRNSISPQITQHGGTATKNTYRGGAETRRKQKQKLKSKKPTQKNLGGRGELKKESNC